MNYASRISCLLAVGLLALSGCSKYQIFHLTLTVVDATDGTPVSGALVAIDIISGSESRKDDPVPLDTIYRANERGHFEHDISISGYLPTSSSSQHGKWYLKVRKDGYEPVIIDIKPNPLPEPINAKIPLTVKVEMRPVKKPTR